MIGGNGYAGLPVSKRGVFKMTRLQSEKVKFLKLVFQLNEDEKTKAEGIWS